MIKLYLLGEKGFKVLEHMVSNYKNMVHSVVGAVDHGVANDFSREIQELSNNCGLVYIDRLNDIAWSGCTIAIGWRWMLPVTNDLIIIHDSLLPKYRGFAPLVNCLINGELEIGATALYGGGDFDRGAIIKQASIEVKYPIKIQKAIDQMSMLYVDIVDQIVGDMKGCVDFKSIEQNEHDATYSVWRDEDDYWIDWRKDSHELARFIDAVGHPYSGAKCLLNGKVVIIRDAEPFDDVRIMDRQSAIGKQLFSSEGCPVVVCSTGLLKITKIDSENGVPMLPLKKFRNRFTGVNVHEG